MNKNSLNKFVITCERYIGEDVSFVKNNDKFVITCEKYIGEYVSFVKNNIQYNYGQILEIEYHSPKKIIYTIKKDFNYYSLMNNNILTSQKINKIYSTGYLPGMIVRFQNNKRNFIGVIISIYFLKIDDYQEKYFYNIKDFFNNEYYVIYEEDILENIISEINK